jgi:hypothetical protein
MSKSESTSMVIPVNQVYVPIMNTEMNQDQNQNNNQDKPIDNPEIVTVNPIVSKILMSSAQYQEITKSINSVNKEFRLFINPDELSTIQVDTANVSMITLNYKKSGFEMFKSEGNHEIGIDVIEWMKFSKLVKKGSLVLFEVTRIEGKQSPEDKKNDIHNYGYKYTLSCNGNNQTITALDINTIRKLPHVPSVDLTTKINIQSSELIETLKSAKAVNDKITMIVNDQGFSVIAESDRSTLNKQVNIIGRTGPDVKAIFSTDYLVDFCKSIQNKKEIVTLSLKTDYPVKITMSDETREINFLMAPRIESN